jgi:hypothetical protein
LFNNRFVCDDHIGGFPIEQSVRSFSALLSCISFPMVYASCHSRGRVKSQTIDDTSHFERELFDYMMTIQYYIDIITISVPYYCLFVDESLMFVDLCAVLNDVYYHR